MLQRKGWKVNRKRVERIWREEGLRVPQRRRKRRPPHPHDGSCGLLRAGRHNEVWSHDIVSGRVANGGRLRLGITQNATHTALVAKMRPVPGPAGS